MQARTLPAAMAASTAIRVSPSAFVPDTSLGDLQSQLRVRIKKTATSRFRSIPLTTYLSNVPVQKDEPYPQYVMYS